MMDSENEVLNEPPAKRLRRDYCWSTDEDIEEGSNDIGESRDGDERYAKYYERSCSDESDAGYEGFAGVESIGHQSSGDSEGDSGDDGYSQDSLQMEESYNDSSQSNGSDRNDIVDNAVPMDDMDGEALSFEDIKDVTVRRSDLVKWLNEPFFEDLVAGCFVRYATGASGSGTIVYRLCRVKNVDATKKDRVYKLDGLITSKYVNLVWGAEDSATRLSMEHLSDSPPLQCEFQEWLRAIRRKSVQMPKRQDLLNKKGAIQEIRNSDVPVRQIMQERLGAQGADEVRLVSGVQAGVVTKSAALEAGKAAGKLVDTSAPVDQGTRSDSLLNIRLDITSASQQKSGGPPSATHSWHTPITNQAQVTSHFLNNPDSVYSSMKDLLLTISNLSSSSTSTSQAPVSGETNLRQALETFYDLAKKNLTDIIKDDTVEAMRKVLPTLTMCASSLTPEQAHSVEFLQVHFEEMISQHKEYVDFQQEFKTFKDSFGSSLEDLTKKQQDEDQRQAELSEITGRERELEEEMRRLCERRNNVNQARISSSHSIGVSVLKVKQLLEKKPQMEMKKNNSKKGLLSLTKQWDSMRNSFL